MQVRPVSIAILLMLAGLPCVGCRKTYRTRVKVTTRPTTRTITSQLVPLLTFPSEAALQALVKEVNGKKIEEAHRLLGPVDRRVVVSASGNEPRKLGREAEEAAESFTEGKVPPEFAELYRVAAPFKGTLRLQVEKGVVVEARFHPETE